VRDAPDEYVVDHDTEWGVPVEDDRRLFEKICLEGFQSGLSWLTIPRERDPFHQQGCAVRAEVECARAAFSRP
jgi:DNA-3-methyladenine glycosylase I